MKDPAQRDQQPESLMHQGFFVLRTPLLSAQEFVDWTTTGACAGSKTHSAESIAAQHQALSHWLRQRAECPVFRDAIYLASPSLYRSLDAWNSKPTSEQSLKAELAVVRYFTRMTHRATPFGLFAGCSLGTITQETKLQLVSRAQYVRKTRLDHAVVSRILDQIIQHPTLRSRLRYRRNDTLILAAGRWRHAAIKETADGHVSFHLVATDRSPYLDAVLDRAQQFESLDVLQQTVAAAAPSASQEDAAAFLQLLIRNQILCCELSVPVTGIDPIQWLSTQLESRDAYADHPALHPLRTSIAELDKRGLAVSPTDYEALSQQLAAQTSTADTKHLVQVDLWKPVTHASISADLVRQVRQAVKVLARLQRSRSRSPLSHFKESFQRRYEGQRVPLLTALDPEYGVGFDEPKGVGEEATVLLADLTLRLPSHEASTAWSDIDRKLLALVLTARETGTHVVQLSQAWIDSLREERIPSALAVLGALFTERETEREAETQRDEPGSILFRLESALGPSAASLLGRFCHADPALHDAVQMLAAREQALHPHELLVEIAHRLPGRTGNIALRPVLRRYELELLGRSGADSQNQLRLDELSVFLRDDELWLYCERLRKRVRPRLSNAHNYSHPRNLHIYRFLCAIQEEEGTAGLHFHWGPLSSLDHLPRVSLGSVVLSPARWRLDPKSLAALGNPLDAQQRERVFLGIQAIRNQHRLPRQIQLVEGDNTLFVDLDNVLSVLAFVDYARNRPQLLIEEALDSLDSAVVSGPEGRYTNEVIIPLLQTDDPARNVPNPSSSIPDLRTPSHRCHPVGTQWLYCKLYTGMATADRILHQQIAPLVARLSSHGVDRWFFIRYSDPDWHLRLRFHGDPSRLLSDVLPQVSVLSQRLLADGQVSRLQLDTYEPEWERYGGEEGVFLSEQIFCADSEAALSLLPLCMGESRAMQRWQVALASMLSLLADFFPDMTDRLSVASSAYDSFRREFAADRAVTWRLGSRFRTERSRLEQLHDDLEQSQADNPLVAALTARSAVVLPIARQLQSLAQLGRLRVSLPSLVQSHLHMSANRILRSAARAQELVLYDWLCRLYRSALARRSQRTDPPEPDNRVDVSRTVAASTPGQALRAAVQPP